MKKFFKTLLALTMVIAMTLSLVACSQPTQSAPQAPAAQAPAEKKVTNIVFWYSWTDKIQANNIALTKEFNETVGKELGINVTAEYQGTYNDLHQKLQAAHVAGVTPAVTVMEIASVKTFANNGVIDPLDKYIARDKVDVSDFQPGLMKNSIYNGKNYGLPYLRSTPLMYLNATILKQAGLNPDGPKTWDEFSNYVKTVKEKTGKFGVTTFSYIWTLEAFMMQRGSSVLNAEETATNMNTDTAKKVITYFKDLSDKGYANLLASSQSDKQKVDIMNQSTAIWFGSTGDLTTNLKIAADNGFELKTAFIPMDKAYGVTSGGANIVMTTKQSEEAKEASWQFIKWLTAKEQTIKASKNTGYLPTRNSAKDSEEMLALYKEVPQFKVALDQLQYAVGRPSNPGYAESTTKIQQALDAIWINNQDTNKVLAELETSVNKLLTEK